MYNILSAWWIPNIQSDKTNIKGPISLDTLKTSILCLSSHLHHFNLSQAQKILLSVCATPIEFLRSLDMLFGKLSFQQLGFFSFICVLWFLFPHTYLSSTFSLFLIFFFYLTILFQYSTVTYLYFLFPDFTLRDGISPFSFFFLSFSFFFSFIVQL